MPVQHFTIKMQEGIVATSYAAGDKFFIDPYKLLPMDRFLPRPKGAPSPGGRGERIAFPESPRPSVGKNLNLPQSEMHMQVVLAKVQLQALGLSQPRGALCHLEESLIVLTMC